MIVLAGLAVGACFVSRQRRVSDPMLDLRLFRRRGFSASVAINAVAAFALIGNAVFLTQYLQSVLGMSALRAALWSIVPSVAVGAAAPVAATLSGRFGRPWVMAGGFVVAAVGFGVTTLAGPRSSVLVILLAAGILAVGLVAVLTLVTDLAMSVIDVERAGAASSVLETGSEFGGALGIAILGSIGAAIYRQHVAGLVPAGLHSRDESAIRQTLAGATVAARRIASPTRDAVLVAARDAFTTGMHVVAVVAAGIMLCAATVCATALRSASTPAGSSEPAKPSSAVLG